MRFELCPQQDRRKSFYRKAFISVDMKQTNKQFILESYDSEVCMIKEKPTELGIEYEIYLNSEIDYDLIFSRTTIRHIKEFLVQYNGHNFSTKEIKKLPKIRF